MSACEPLTTHRNGFKTLSKRAWGNDVRRTVGGACLWLTRQPVHRRHDLVAGFDMESGNLTRSPSGAEQPVVVSRRLQCGGAKGVAVGRARTPVECKAITEAWRCLENFRSVKKRQISELLAHRYYFFQAQQSPGWGSFTARSGASSFQHTDPNGRSNIRRTRKGPGPMWKVMACRSNARSDWVERFRWRK